MVFPFGNPTLELRRLRRRDREALYQAMSAQPAMAGFGLGALQAGILDAPHSGAAVFGLMRGNAVVAAVFSTVQVIMVVLVVVVVLH